ncbi:unnamed protein product, partial [Rotaria magnacalcarata]
MANDKKED